MFYGRIFCLGESQLWNSELHIKINLEILHSTVQQFSFNTSMSISK